MSRRLAVVADLHPDYRSTQARGDARVAGDAGAAPLRARRGVHGGERSRRAGCWAWPGTAPGYGLDGTVWGGEFLTADRPWVRPRRRTCGRSGCPVASGRSASHGARRSACSTRSPAAGDVGPMSMLLQCVFGARERALLLNALARGVNSPVTTSAGRLFDAVAVARRPPPARAASKGRRRWRSSARSTPAPTRPIRSNSPIGRTGLPWGPGRRRHGCSTGHPRSRRFCATSMHASRRHHRRAVSQHPRRDDRRRRRADRRSRGSCSPAAAFRTAT